MICALILFALSSCRNEYGCFLVGGATQYFRAKYINVFSLGLIDVRKVKKEIDWQKAEKSLFSLKEKGFINQDNDIVSL